jgi:hypothetical protein
VNLLQEGGVESVIGNTSSRLFYGVAVVVVVADIAVVVVVAGLLSG